MQENGYPADPTVRSGWLPLDGMPAIRHIPGFIVNGRLDVVCPPVTAFELKKAWPEARLERVPQASHFGTEPGIAAALLRIMESLK